MRRLIAVILFLAAFGVPRGQNSPTFDSLLNSVLTAYGGSALNVTNAQVTGSITYLDGNTNSFSLTLQGRSLRFEASLRGGKTFTVLRQDNLVQSIRPNVKGATVMDFPDQFPVSTSEMNTVPIFMLLHLKNDPRFTGSVVQAPDGSIGLRFIEGMPPGFKPSPFRQPKTIAIFWLDAVSRITSVTYTDDQNRGPQMTYKYSYVDALASPFLQPKRVDSLQGSQTIWTVQVASSAVNVSIPSGFFDIHSRN